jgi:Ni,Fe-hydrogenase I small subunit
LEVLIRKLLTHQNQPAVVYLHAWIASFEDRSFYLGEEGDISNVLDYYRVPVLSMRKALYHDTVMQTPGFKPEQHVCDMLHPNRLGHRCAPDRAMITLPCNSWGCISKG